MNPLYRVIIYPIEMLLEFFFTFFYKSFDSLGLAVLGVGFVVSFVTLPLYHVAESIQAKERDQRLVLAGGIRRIKEAFKGDEQYMMLTTFYRQNNYHPLYALRSSLSLIIQVPFFIAAYHFLSTLEILRGSSFFFISDLGQPDGLLSIGNFSINVLPVLMTLINIGASIIYTKDFPLRDKLQLYVLAFLFLILLYSSPAALVLYWTLNNLFSLVKNIFYKMNRPLLVLYVLSVFGVSGLSVTIWIIHPTMATVQRLILVIGCAGVISLPLLIKLANILNQTILVMMSHNPKQRTLLFVLSLMVLFLLQGFLVPANLISSSPIEFAYTGEVTNPLSYVASTLLVFLGLWIIWPLFLYSLATEKVKNFLVFIASFLALITPVNLFIFGGEYGVVGNLLHFDNPALLEANFILAFVPLLVAVIVLALLIWAIKHNWLKWIATTFLILGLGSAVSGSIQSIIISQEFTNYDLNLSKAEDTATFDGVSKSAFHLSEQGNNVLFIFLDRGMNSFFPFILEELPELKAQLEGFVYYPNTISFGAGTIFGAPAMLGGYEYTPDSINKRTTEKLVDKHNESLLVLPKLFVDSNYAVTVTNPPYSNYKWEADFTPFLPYPNIRVLHHNGKFTTRYKKEHANTLNWEPAFESNSIKKRLPAFSILKTSFPILRRTLYEEGRYYQSAMNIQSVDGFIDAYAELYYLKELTDIIESGDNFILIANDTPHQPTTLQTPEFEPRSTITNTSTVLDSLEGVRPIDQSNYHANVAALKRLGIYFEYLRQHHVYDNTRIIIVSDHGRELFSKEMMEFSDDPYEKNRFVPLLLMKDFHATGSLKIDDAFMTNADAPLFAVEGLIENPVNPFTQKDLFSEVQKEQVNVYYGPWDPRQQTGTTFVIDLSQSFSVKDNIYDEANWTRLE